MTYIVPMFPYPSGHIHMGHIRNYSISNVIARYKKQQGFDVLHPIGFDSFGLPAEIAAIKNKVSPKEWTESNIAAMKSDFHAMGFDFDWSHCIETHQFDYYRFEQQLFRASWEAGFIYKKDKFVNFDPVDKTILSNEQVHNGRGWRSGALVVRRKMPMYFFDMRRYAEELMTNDLDWPKRVKDMQRNWINVRKGEDIRFDIKGQEFSIFYEPGDYKSIVVGINHKFQISSPEWDEWFQNANTGSVAQKGTAKPMFDTQCAVVFEGKTYPIFIDIDRDEDGVFSAYDAAYEPNTIGTFVSRAPGTFIGLKDWCISRQRYWGNPIPIIECEKCGDVVSEDVRLPEDLVPDGNGNILERTPEFYECVCPVCQGPAKRCTDTMDTFVQSAWYFQRYIDPQSPQMIPKPDAQVDVYVGGVEHATMHLIYARFFHKMMRDLGFVSTDEPIKKLITQGMVCKKVVHPDGRTTSSKMSKSLGNVVAPKEYIDKYGSDAVQMFMIFAAPPQDNFDFDDAGMIGCYRFLQEVITYFKDGSKATQNIAEVDCIAAMDKLESYIVREFDGRGNLNTIIPQLMTTFKTIKRTNFIDAKEAVERRFLQQLGIFAPKTVAACKPCRIYNM